MPLLRSSRSVAAPASAVTDAICVEAADGSVLPTEVQEGNDSGEEEVASDCKPAADDAAAAVSGSAAQAAPVTACNTATRDALTAGAAGVAAANEPAAADDHDAGGDCERPASAATPDLGAFAQSALHFPWSGQALTLNVTPSDASSQVNQMATAVCPSSHGVFMTSALLQAQRLMVIDSELAYSEAASVCSQTQH